MPSCSSAHCWQRPLVWWPRRHLDGADFAAIMLRYGYDALATGVIAASGHSRRSSPSLVLIVLADQLGRSVATCIRRNPSGWR